MKQKSLIASLIATVLSFSNCLFLASNPDSVKADEGWQKVDITRDLDADIAISPDKIHVPITQPNLDRILIEDSNSYGINFYFFDSELNYLNTNLEKNGAMKLVTGFSENGISSMSADNFSLWDKDGHLLTNNRGQLWGGSGIPFQTYCHFSLGGYGFSELVQITNYAVNAIPAIKSSDLQTYHIPMEPAPNNENKIDIFGNSYDLVNNAIFYHTGNSVYRFRLEDGTFLKLFDISTDDGKMLSDFACTMDNQLFASFTDGSIAKLNRDGTVAEFLPTPNYDDLDPGMAFDHHYDLSATRYSLIVYPRYFREGLYEPGNRDYSHPIDTHWYFYPIPEKEDSEQSEETSEVAQDSEEESEQVQEEETAEETAEG